MGERSVIKRSFLLAACLALAVVRSVLGQEIAGSGSTFAFPIITRWADTYRSLSGIRIVYQPIGSAAGISQVRAGLVDFGVSDKPLYDSQLLRDGLLQFPLVFGAVVPIVNLDGIAPGRLRLSGEILADIYMGRIKDWSDPAIAALNPDMELPRRPILPIYRSDGSGTTFNWTDYLSKKNQAWRTAVGSDMTVRWPVGAGAKGNSGVAASVARVPGSIGYVEYSYAMKAKLSYALVRNRAGNFVQPSERSFRSAVLAADWTSEPDFRVLITDGPASDAYPIMATSFVLVAAHPKDTVRSKATQDFFRWALTDGGPTAQALAYLPLPDSLVDQVEAYWAVNRP